MSKDDKDVPVEIEDSINQEPPETENEPPADSLRILEALIFASDDILTSTRIKAILPGNPDARQIRKMVEKINAILQKERHPFEIVEIGGGYQFRTVSYYHPWVRQIFKEKAAKKLSIQSLECLAIVAYKQPLSKAEIEAIRGVISDGAMKTLLEKRLITITGRSEKPGRPLLYGTTHDFLKYFGLNKIEDLPRLEEFEAIAREKISELSIDELQEEQISTSEEESPVSDTEIIMKSDVSSSEPENNSTEDHAIIETEINLPVQPCKLSDSEHIFENNNSKDSQKNLSETPDNSTNDPEATTVFDSDQSSATADDDEEVFEPIDSKGTADNKEPKFNDGITEEEMTETAIQVRDMDTKIFSHEKNQPDQEKISQADKEQGTVDDSEEDVLEVIIPPPEKDDI